MVATLRSELRSLTALPLDLREVGVLQSGCGNQVEGLLVIVTLAFTCMLVVLELGGSLKTSLKENNFCQRFDQML